MFCGILIPPDIFWGRNTPHEFQHWLLIVACAWDLGRFFLRGAIYWAAARPKEAFSISEMMAYHQRERALLLNLKHPWAPRDIASSSRDSDVPESSRDSSEDTIHTNVRLRGRRRVQQALFASDVVWLSLWFLVFALRRPFGFLAVGCWAGFGYLGLAAFPLPEDPADRQLGALFGHYVCAVVCFSAFIGVLACGHGWCTAWPLLPFGLVTLLALSCALLGHNEAVKRHSRAASCLNVASVVAEWAALSIFYVALALPPDYAPSMALLKRQAGGALFAELVWLETVQM